MCNASPCKLKLMKEEVKYLKMIEIDYQEKRE